MTSGCTMLVLLGIFLMYFATDLGLACEGNLEVPVDHPKLDALLEEDSGLQDDVKNLGIRNKTDAFLEAESGLQHAEKHMNTGNMENQVEKNWSENTLRQEPENGFVDASVKQLPLGEQLSHYGGYSIEHVGKKFRKCWKFKWPRIDTPADADRWCQFTKCTTTPKPSKARSSSNCKSVCTPAPKKKPVRKCNSIAVLTLCPPVAPPPPICKEVCEPAPDPSPPPPPPSRPPPPPSYPKPPRKPSTPKPPRKPSTPKPPSHHHKCICPPPGIINSDTSFQISPCTKLGKDYYSPSDLEKPFCCKSCRPTYNKKLKY